MNYCYNTQNPKKQVNDEISAEDVTCNVGLIPVIKSSNGDSLCVTPDSANELQNRGLIN